MVPGTPAITGFTQTHIRRSSNTARTATRRHLAALMVSAEPEIITMVFMILTLHYSDAWRTGVIHTTNFSTRYSESSSIDFKIYRVVTKVYNCSGFWRAPALDWRCHTLALPAIQAGESKTSASVGASSIRSAQRSSSSRLACSRRCSAQEGSEPNRRTNSRLNKAASPF